MAGAEQVKTCARCQKAKSLKHDFYPGRATYCKDCRKDQKKQWKSALPACSVDDCDRPSVSLKSGICQTHRYRRKGGDRSPIKTRRSTQEVIHRNAAGEKQCSSCEQWLPELCYKRIKQTTDGLNIKCKRCCSDQEHNLTLERRDQLIAEQGGRCAGPNCDLEFDIYGENTYRVDHSHRCCAGNRSCGACIRGLLCNTCNLQARDVDYYLNWLAYCLERDLVILPQDVAQVSPSTPVAAR